MGQGLATATLEFGPTWLVQSTVLLALGLLAGRCLRGRGPAVRSAVYRTTLVGVLACPAVSALLATAGVRLSLPNLRSAPASSVGESSSATVGVGIAEALPDDPQGVLAAPSPPSALPDPSRRVPAQVAGPPVVAIAVPAVWLIGSTVLALRLLLGHRRMGRLRASSLPAEPAARTLCRDLADRMRLPAPEVLRSPLLFSPCLVGLRRPAILLPDDVEGNLRETLVHELAHLARRDVFWNLLGRCVVAAFWFQPLLLILTRRMEAAAEEVCDDHVVQFGGDRVRYAGHLLELADRALPPVAPVGVGMVSLRSSLARRIARILDSSRSPSTRVDFATVMTMLAVGFAVTLLSGLLTVGGRGRAQAQEVTQVDDAKGAPAVNAARGDSSIVGRIVDQEGRPIPGVTVRIISTASSKTGNLKPWLDAVRRGETTQAAGRHINRHPEPAASRRQTTTDAQGRVRFEGLDAESLVHLTVQGPTIATAAFTVTTRHSESITAKGFPTDSATRPETIYGAHFTFAAVPDRPVEGVIRDAKTNGPLPGVEIQSKRVLTTNGILLPVLKTVTDRDGRFRFNGLPRTDRTVLTAVPNENQPYLTREIMAPDVPGNAPIAVDVGLHRGIWIEGRVTDKATGRPIKDARLHYLPFLDNKYAQALPEFHKGGFGIDRAALQHQYVTKADGTYRMVGLPGHAIVGVDLGERLPYRFGYGSETIKGMDNRGYFPTWMNPGPSGRDWPLSMKEIDPAEGVEVVRVDLQLDPGASVRVRAVDPQGQPLAGLTVQKRTSMGSTEEIPGSEFDVVAMGTDEERLVAVWHKGRKLGAVASIRARGENGKPVVVELQPLATIVGRVLGPDGAPAIGVSVQPFAVGGTGFSLNLPMSEVDKEGQFRVPDVPVGVVYRLTYASRAQSRLVGRGVSGTIEVRPGESTDVEVMRLPSSDVPRR